MKTKNGQKGITLVALVITIIILLILAGISIASLTQTGLFEKAKDAKQKSENAQVKENEILENYLAQIDEITGGKKTDSEQSTYTAYNVGDEVTIGTESFYVIEASDANTETVKLLAAKNIGTDSSNTETYLKQTDSAQTIKFSDTNYWSSETSYPVNLNNYESASIKSTDAISLAKAYGTSIKESLGTNLEVKGRLMIPEEVVALGGDNTENYTTSGCPSWINSTTYWLSSANDSDIMWIVFGGNEWIRYNGFGNVYVNTCGVRPVIEISKSLIQ